jgi:peptide deformylase
MIRPIIHDPLFLAQKSEPATEADRQIIVDLAETLNANLDRCVGMAANMIGERKRVILFCNGPMLMAMVNPRITAKDGEYEAEEGCLSLTGVRKTKRYQKITVQYLDAQFRPRTGTFTGFTAQIIQHEIDHCDGILI